MRCLTCGIHIMGGTECKVNCGKKGCRCPCNKTPKKGRCTAWSKALAGQCDLEAGHEGMHDSAGDGFHQ